MCRPCESLRVQSARGGSERDGCEVLTQHTVATQLRMCRMDAWTGAPCGPARRPRPHATRTRPLARPAWAVAWRLCPVAPCLRMANFFAHASCRIMIVFSFCITVTITCAAVHHDRVSNTTVSVSCISRSLDAVSEGRLSIAPHNAVHVPVHPKHAYPKHQSHGLHPHPHHIQVRIAEYGCVPTSSSSIGDGCGSHETCEHASFTRKHAKAR